MRPFPNNDPLTDAELDHLERFLKNCNGGMAMNIEELDGFLAALIAGPETVAPSEYMTEVFGSNTSESHQFESLEEANEILGLLMRHWNDIAGTLSRGEVHLPLILEDENGMGLGNDWARGFIRGTRLRRDGWAELLADDDRGGCMIPMLMLYHEHDADPTIRPKPITPEKREKVIESMAIGLVGAYRHFRQREKPSGSVRPLRSPHISNKIGRNDQCPCGSRKKFKRCCGAATIH
jgi:uncharacterized protein